MPTATQSKIQDFIDTKIQPAADALQKAAEEQKPKVQDAINKLSEAIKAKNLPLISRHLNTLEQLKVPPYASLLPATKALLAQLAKLQPAADSEEDLKQIDSLTKSLGELQGKLERNYDRIKELEPWFHGEYVVILKDGTKLTSSAAHSQALHRIVDAT